MADQHSQNFFGQKTGLILDSDAKNKPHIFIRCLRKKKTGKWEKFDESKVVKLSLLELIAIYDVLDHKRKLWNTFHQFKEIKTPISFAWDEYDDDLLWINIDNYSRPLNYPQTELLRRILSHIIEEKIAYATVREDYSKADHHKEKRSKSPGDLEQRQNHYSSSYQGNQSSSKTHTKSKPDNNMETSASTGNGKFSNLTAKIKIGREKALLLVLEDGQEIWLPKSTIIGDYNEQAQSFQQFKVKNWILEKRNLISAS